MDTTVAIDTEFIRLDHMMKLAGTVQTGGEAKQRIQGGEVLVNGETCLQRGKKMRDGDKFSLAGQEVVLTIQK